MTDASWRRWWAAVACLAVAALAGACAPAAPDLVLVDGRVFTADPERPWAEALAVRGDRIVAVGSSVEVSALVGPATVRRQLGGRVVVPGFNDAHVTDPNGPPAAIRVLAAEAMAAGVTSMQWFVGERTVRDAGRALVEADVPLRVRVLRMPRPGPDGETIDSRPHLPPQPTIRIDIRGMGFRLRAADEARIRQAVGWAYGTEDLLAIEPLDAGAMRAYVAAVTATGIPEVWRRKRPRIEQAPMAVVGQLQAVASLGLVAVQRPDGTVPLASLVQAGVPLALATDTATRPFAALAAATSTAAGSERLTMAQAITALTRGSAYAQLADRDKGHLTIGALADLAVLSVDPFAEDADLSSARSVLTLIGGRVVHDVP